MSQAVLATGKDKMLQVVRNRMKRNGTPNPSPDEVQAYLNFMVAQYGKRVYSDEEWSRGFLDWCNSRGADVNIVQN